MILSKIAVLLDLSEMDAILLNYIKKLHESYGFESVLLIHFVEVEEFPHEIYDMYPELNDPIEKIIEDEIREQAADCLDECKAIANVHVHGGGKVDEFIEWVQEQDFDLVVMGKKSALHGAGIFSGKLVRLLNTNMLFVTDIARGAIHKIMVPIDFSSYTTATLRVAREAAKMLNAELIPVHIIKIGKRYFPVDEEPDELYKMLEKEAKKKYTRLKEKLKLTEDCVYINELDQHVSKTIYNHAVFQSVDLMIIGHKGKTSGSELLLGSVAERMIAHDKSIPVLIAKEVRKE
ncbi:universal stress protein [Roseimarinus sediminis]|uniref:universal stress protein n=1 Tax=Roseimarinus sediminis TaxID=1610899 RepID=UPI003D1AD33C